MKKPVLFLSTLILIFLSSTIYAQEFNKKNVSYASSNTDKLKEAPKKVFIKNFKIYYQMIAEEVEKVQGGRQFGGGSYTGDATARLAVGVEGVDPEDLQELTNDVYSAYVEKLEALGLEVIISSELPKKEFFEDWELLKGPRINQEQIEGSLMVIPDNFDYYVKKVKKSGKEKSGAFMGGVVGESAEFQSAIYGPLPKVSYELGDIIVVEVIINIPSIYLDPKSALGTAKIKGGSNLRLQQGRVTYGAGKTKKPGVPYPDSYMEFAVTDAIPIPGVFKEEKFKAVAQRKVTTTPSYASFFTVANSTVNVTNTIECEAAVYKSEVSKKIKDYLNFTLEPVEKGLKGEKVKKLE